MQLTLGKGEDLVLYEKEVIELELCIVQYKIHGGGQDFDHVDCIGPGARRNNVQRHPAN